MKKKLICGGVIFSLLLVIGAVIYLNAAPRWCYYDDEWYCEDMLNGTFYAYFAGIVTYMGNPVNVYDLYCYHEIVPGYPEMVWWGSCYDIDGVYD